MAPVAAWWRARSNSERRTLALTTLLALPLLYWALVWDPLADARNALRSRLAEQQGTLLWLEQIEALAGASTPAETSTGLPPGTSLLRLVDETLRARGLAAGIERIEPGDDDREVRIWLREVPFDTLVGWLGTVSREHGLRTDRAGISRGRDGDAGRVTARIDLRAP
jgi:general secretion pathway protein M